MNQIEKIKAGNRAKVEQHSFRVNKPQFWAREGSLQRSGQKHGSLEAASWAYQPVGDAQKTAGTGWRSPSESGSLV
jgi:hypothetical protein